MWFGKPRAGPRVAPFFCFSPPFCPFPRLPPVCRCFNLLGEQNPSVWLIHPQTAPTDSSNSQHHGVRKQLRPGSLRVGPQEEEPHSDGSDWDLLRRGQEEEEQGEEDSRNAVVGISRSLNETVSFVFYLVLWCAVGIRRKATIIAKRSFCSAGFAVFI